MYYLEPRSSPSREDTMSEDRELLKIGEFAQLAGSNLRTIRYYEELGLLRPRFCKRLIATMRSSWLRR